MNGVEPYAYLRELFISIANGHPAKDIDGKTACLFSPARR
jgi:hypothetical protein